VGGGVFGLGGVGLGFFFFFGEVKFFQGFLDKKKTEKKTEFMR